MTNVYLILLAWCAVLSFATANDFNATKNVLEHDFVTRVEDDSLAHLAKSIWNKAAQDEVQRRTHYVPKTKKTKNIIFFLGNGMSLSNLAEARNHLSQNKSKPEDEGVLSFDKFPHSAFSQTQCTHGKVAEAACTATAYLCGVKTDILLIGVHGQVNFNDCHDSSNAANHVESIASWAQKAGKSTGIITTKRVTHASTAGTYAHVANRMWESDRDVANCGVNPAVCSDIATQLITQLPGRNFNVIMGGGRSKLLPNTVVDESGAKGERLDGVNLIAKWQTNHPNGAYVTNRNDLLNLNYTATKNILGLFHYSDLEYHLTANSTAQPTLSDMTASAIKILEKNHKGYFLFIESGHMGHVDEMIEFDGAINRALKLTTSSNTLILVSSNHAGKMLKIKSVNKTKSEKFIPTFEKFLVSDDDLENTLLLDDSTEKQWYENESDEAEHSLETNLPSKSLTLSNEEGLIKTYIGKDVGVYAIGPFSRLFRGVMQQNLIPHLIAYAACLGHGQTFCKENNYTMHNHHNKTNKNSTVQPTNNMETNSTRVKNDTSEDFQVYHMQGLNNTTYNLTNVSKDILKSLLQGPNKTLGNSSNFEPTATVINDIQTSLSQVPNKILDAINTSVAPKHEREFMPNLYESWTLNNPDMYRA